MTAHCPFCEAVHPIPAASEVMSQRLHCPCKALALLCAPNTEPETSVRLSEMGLGDTKADMIDNTLSVVSAREWWRRSAAASP